ncbi:MAG: HAD-IIB family hydrolase, partial [Phycisphaeraceae bacterium]|nr:HAD-IIB family hydrolase [Phycisphaeraceae bacterium]
MQDAPDIQLVAIDVDGTLLRAKRQMSFKVISAIIAASQRGVKVVLASARPPRTMREIYDHLKLDTPMINYNGALIHDPVQRRHIHHRPMHAGLVKRMIRAARKLDPKVIVSLEILDKWYTDDVDDSLPTETSRDFDPDFIGPLESFLHVPVTKLMLLAPPDRIGAIREVIERRFQGRVAIMVSDEHVLQIVH